MKHLIRKSIISILIINLLLITYGCTSNKVEPKEEIYIYYTSDVHCGIEDNMTFAGIKDILNKAKEEHANVSLVDLGDFVQGGTYGSLTKGEMIVDLMNKMEYDIVTIGNHEFDYGMEQLDTLIGNLSSEVVASNVKYSGNKKNIFENIPEYIIKDYGGTKVAFLGILTPHSITTSTPTNFMEDGVFVYDFYNDNEGEELFNKVQSVVDEVRKQNVDYVVALSHLGSNTRSEPFDSISLIANTEGIDVVLDGHSHSVIIGDAYPNKNGEDVILSSVGTKLEALGELIIEPDGTITTLHIDEYEGRDEEMAKELAKADESIDAVLSEYITTLDFDMNIYDEDGIRMCRTRETTVGDFMADAIRTVLKTDICLINGGGVRDNILSGEITYNSLYTIAPFQNSVASCYATGKQIKDALEYGAQNTESIYKFDGNAVGEFGGFLQVSGLKYTIDTSIPSSVVVDENGMFEKYSNDDRRVVDVMVERNGEYVPLEDDEIYTVASLNYLLFESGDGNTAFSNCEPIVANGEVDIEVLKEYLEMSNGFKDTYKDIEGRITVK